MNLPSFIRRTGTAAGLLLLAAGLTVWLSARRQATRASASDPGPTLQEAAMASRSAVRAVRPQLSPPPTEPSPDGPAIRLRTGIVRPGIPLDPAPAHARPSARGFPWLVLFDAPVRPEWRTAIEQAGGVIRSYLPDHALLTEAPAEARARIGQLPHVAWTGEYRPEHKIQPLLAALACEEPALPVPVTLQTFAPDDEEPGPRTAAAGASDIRTAPGRRWGLVRAAQPAGGRGSRPPA